LPGNLSGLARKKVKEGGFPMKAVDQSASTAPTLSVDDLEISDVDIYGLDKEEAMGVPEMGASYGTYGCTSRTTGKG
jgi:hypothetical protein